MTTTSTTRSRAISIAGLATVIVLALSVRGAVLWQTREVPFVEHPVGDARGYVDWGRRIAEGDWLGTEAFYQAPLYPYVLGLVFKVTGCGTDGIRILQAMWGAAACGFLSWGTARLWTPRAGLYAGVLAALYGPAIYYDGLIQKASLDGLLAAAIFAGCAARTRSPDGLGFLCIGFLVGLASLNRENVLVWVPILLLWAYTVAGTDDVSGQLGAKETIRSGRVSDGRGSARAANGSRLSATLALGAGILVVLGPVAVRNRVIGGSWQVTTFQAGSNFYIGNSRDADGRYRPLVRGHETPEFERADATRLAEAALGRPLGPGEVSRYWFGRARADIERDPWRWAQLLVRKLHMVWNRYEVPDVEGLVVYTESASVLRWVTSLWHFGWLCPLALLGAAARGPRPCSAGSPRSRPVTGADGLRRTRTTQRVILFLSISMSLSVAAFYVLGRYRHSAAVLLIPFAGSGLAAIADRLGALRRGKRGSSDSGDAAVALAPSAAPNGNAAPVRGEQAPPLRLRRRAVPALLVGVVVNWPVQDERSLDAHVLMNAGVALAQTGSLDRATDFFRRAVEAIPGSAEANNNLAQALALRGDFERAIPLYETALRFAADLPSVEYNLAVALERVGRLREAVEHYERALKADPADSEARRALERVSR